MGFILKPIAFAAAAWWRVLLLFLLNSGALILLLQLEARFTAVTGLPVLDTQNDLTRDELAAQLPLYTGAARDAYLAFSAFDYLFPLIGGLALASAAAWLLHRNPTEVARRLLANHIPAYLLLPTLSDWLENMSALLLLQFGPTPALLTALLLGKRVKLLTLNAGFLAVLLLLLFTIAARLRSFSQRRGAG